jgi:hypothetical protein
VTASWYPDPTGRHDCRFWDGGAWTSHVSDGGTRSCDEFDNVLPAPRAVDTHPVDHKVFEGFLRYADLVGLTTPLPLQELSDALERVGPHLGLAIGDAPVSFALVATLRLGRRTTPALLLLVPGCTVLGWSAGTARSMPTVNCFPTSSTTFELGLNGTGKRARMLLTVTGAEATATLLLPTPTRVLGDHVLGLLRGTP